MNMFKKYLYNGVPLYSSVIIITHKKLYRTLKDLTKNIKTNLLNNTLL